MAIFLAASLIVKPGDKVIVSDPNYFIVDNLFTSLGVKLIRVPVDDNGMNIDKVESILKKHKVKLLYITPHHHHPTTVTLSSSRRAKLLDLINAYHLPVIEDDYDYDFHYKNSPILPLASSNHQGNVIYIGSFTKLLAPSFHVGYMVAPANFIREATNFKCLIDLGGDALMEETISTLIRSGEISRHIKKSNKIYARRCNLICSLLHKRLHHALSFTKPQGGMALWVKFKEKYPLQTVISEAAKHGLIFRSNIYSGGNNNAIRIGFASLNEEEINMTINILETITAAY